MKQTIIALTIVASCVAARNPFSALKTKFSRPQQVTQVNEDWPEGLHWPIDYETHGAVYYWNETAQELVSYQNTTLSIYYNGNGDRQKVITHTDIQGLGFTEILSYSDFAAHKQYTKIPKL